MTLSDLSGQSLDVARRNAENGIIHRDAVIHANALDVPLHPACVDLHATFHLVLCLGPLYNLIAPHNRSTIIRNSIKMVKSGGTIYAPSSRTFVTRQDVIRFVFRQKGASMNDSYIQNGDYTRNPNTESYHVHSVDLAQQLLLFQTEIVVERPVSCEGFLGIDCAKVIATLSDKVKRRVDVVIQSADNAECGIVLIIYLLYFESYEHTNNLRVSSSAMRISAKLRVHSRWWRFTSRHGSVSATS